MSPDVARHCLISAGGVQSHPFESHHCGGNMRVSSGLTTCLSARGGMEGAFLLTSCPVHRSWGSRLQAGLCLSMSPLVCVTHLPVACRTCSEQEAISQEGGCRARRVFGCVQTPPPQSGSVSVPFPRQSGQPDTAVTF